LVFDSHFSVTLNGKDAPFISELLNQVEQTGPTSYIVSAVIPSGFFPDIASGKLVITIDETTGKGDGYAVDFVKLLVNYDENLFTGKFSGTTEPGATVRLSGTNTTVTAGATGNFSFQAIPGLNAVRVSKAGFSESYAFGIVLSSETEWEPEVQLSRGVGKPDIDFSKFGSTDAWANAAEWGKANNIINQLETEGQITLYINFDTGKATLKPDAAEVITEIVTALKARPDMKVKLEGHTDNVGNAADNKKLSDDRANAVLAAIVEKGIDKLRLTAEGFGFERPIANNNTEEGRARNRRVELVKQ